MANQDQVLSRTSASLNNVHAREIGVDLQPEPIKSDENQYVIDTGSVRFRNRKTVGPGLFALLPRSI
jgi:hypothetical protein